MKMRERKPAIMVTLERETLEKLNEYVIGEFGPIRGSRMRSKIINTVLKEFLEFFNRQREPQYQTDVQ